jgi:hypothetical protein
MQAVAQMILVGFVLLPFAVVALLAWSFMFGKTITNRTEPEGRWASDWDEDENNSRQDYNISNYKVS